MSIKTRQSLKSIFINGSIPTEKDFADLIDSALIKRDDCFFGKWQPGISYEAGNVVIYKKSLYILVLEGNNDKECDNHIGNEESTNSICSNTPPDDDCRWELIELQVEDDDWAVIPDPENEDERIMYSKVFGKIGIGTKNPETRLDLTDGEKGQFLLDPDGKDDPHFKIINLDPKCSKNFLDTSVGKEYTTWLTDVPLGYVFKKITKDHNHGEEVAKKKVKIEKESKEYLLMLVTNNDQGVARVGINTLNPNAQLDVLEENRGSIQLNPGEKKYPELVLINLHPDCNDNYFSLKSEPTFVSFNTNAEGGFRFVHSPGNYDSKSSSNTLVVIDKRGNVGIGTDEPEAKLVVTDNSSGKFKMTLSKTNPALSIINLKPATKARYLTLGADNDYGIFVTDGPDGFVFKAGGKCGEKDHDQNINQGDKIAYIHPKKRIGVGIYPDEYELDVYGNVRCFGLYLNTDYSKMDDVRPLDDVMAKIMRLEPKKFKWDKNKTNCGEEGDQIGFYAHDVDGEFPELVKNHDGNKAVAYPNMSAVLVKAIQEQQEIIEKQNKKLDELEKKICELEEKLNKK